MKLIIFLDLKLIDGLLLILLLKTQEFIELKTIKRSQGSHHHQSLNLTAPRKRQELTYSNE